MDERLVFLGQSHPGGYVAGVDGNCRRVSSRIAIARIERSNESRRERQARTLKASVGLLEIRDRLTLLLVEMNQTLQRDRRNQKCPDDCHGIELVSIDEQSDDGRVEGRVNE